MFDYIQCYYHPTLLNANFQFLYHQFQEIYQKICQNSLYIIFNYFCHILTNIKFETCNLWINKRQPYLTIPHVFTRVLGFLPMSSRCISLGNKRRAWTHGGLMINNMDHKLTFKYIWGNHLSKDNNYLQFIHSNDILS